jgi:hypothetical protein
MDELFWPVLYAVFIGGGLAILLNALAKGGIQLSKASTRILVKERKPGSWMRYANHGFAAIAMAVLFCLGFWLLLDPLTIGNESFSKTQLLAVLFLLVWPLLGLIILAKYKRIALLLGSLLVLLACAYGVQTEWGGNIVNYRTLDTEPVLALLEEKQLAATECVRQGYDLREPYAWSPKWTRNRYADTPVCAVSTASWRANMPGDEGIRGDPIGWRYVGHEDQDVSDGSFSFAMISRRGEVIRCTQERCELQ